LPYSWPRTAIQTPLNYDDENYDPLFAYGYGLSYAKPGRVETLPENAGVELSAKNISEFFKAGNSVFPWEMIIGGPAGKKTVKTSRAVSPGGVTTIESADDGVQENIRKLSFNGKGLGRFEIRGTPIDLSRQATGDMALYMRVRSEGGAEAAKVNLSVDCGKDCSKSQPLDDLLSKTKPGEWTEVSVKLSCFAEGSSLKFVRSPFVIETNDAVNLTLSDVKLVTNEGQAVCLR